jgi:hypothetical protein
MTAINALKMTAASICMLMITAKVAPETNNAFCQFFYPDLMNDFLLVIKPKT